MNSQIQHICCYIRSRTAYMYRGSPLNFPEFWSAGSSSCLQITTATVLVPDERSISSVFLSSIIWWPLVPLSSSHTCWCWCCSCSLVIAVGNGHTWLRRVRTWDYTPLNGKLLKFQNTRNFEAKNSPNENLCRAWRQRNSQTFIQINFQGKKIWILYTKHIYIYIKSYWTYKHILWP